VASGVCPSSLFQFNPLSNITPGPIPIHLIELSPPALRTLLVGFTYQLGNLASSASATIQAIIAERFPLPPSASGDKRYDYGKVIGIFMGSVWAYDFFWLFVGPEMTQEERDEAAEDAMHYERLKKEGMSLTQIGSARARGDFKTVRTRNTLDEESKGQAEHMDRNVERVESKDETAEHIEN
jgi:SHS family lactate transporter-like MFS transporter